MQDQFYGVLRDRIYSIKFSTSQMLGWPGGGVWRPPARIPNRRVSGERSRLSIFYLEFEGFSGFYMNIIVGLKDGHDEEYSYTISLDKQWPLEELEGVDLAFAKLEGVNWERTNLKGAKLVRAKLNKAILKNT